MAYVLMFEKEWKKNNTVNGIHNYIPIKNGKTIYSLDEIDNFSMQFNNNEEMMNYLVKNKIISEENKNDKICILKKYKNLYQKVDNNLIFSEYKEYFNENKIRILIMKQAKDIAFLTSLIDYYDFKHRNDNCYNNAVREALWYIKEKINDDIEFQDTIESYLSNFIDVELYFPRTEWKKRYSSFRNLAMFVGKKEEIKKLNKAKEELLLKKESMENPYIEKEEYKPYGRKLVLKEEGQMSLFDE